MLVRTGAKKHRCKVCHRFFTNGERLQHHWAAEHAPKCSGDIFKTRDIMRKIHSIPQKEVV